MLKELLKRIIVLSSVTIPIINFSVYAYPVNTPTNLSYDPHDVEINYDAYLEELSDEELEIFSNEFIDNTAASDRTVAEYIKDIFITALTEVLPMDDLEKDTPEVIESADEPVMRLANNRDSNKNVYSNTVVFYGTFNSSDCRLVVPYSDYQKLNVINGKLLNVGNSSVTGRILYNSDDLNASDYETYSYILNPVYGSTANVYSYGSFNYQRHYYLNTSSGYNRITYSDTYGDFTVTDTKVFYSASERPLYILYFILLFLGVNWLWCRRH